MTEGLAPERLVFEVTESLAIRDFDLASSALGRIRELGCNVGLDDFGTGFSSLSYLRRLPVDFLKIDRSLIDSVDTDRHSLAIVRSVITMATALGLATIAEGVEREAQADRLTSIGCHFGQGYLFGRPATELTLHPPATPPVA